MGGLTLRAIKGHHCHQGQCFQETRTVAIVSCHWIPQRKGGSSQLSFQPPSLVPAAQGKAAKRWAGWASLYSWLCNSGGWALATKSTTSIVLASPSASDGADALRWYLWTRFTLEVQKRVAISREKVLSVDFYLATGSVFHHRLQYELQSRQSFCCLLLPGEKWSIKAHLVGTSVRHLRVLILRYFLIMWFLGF